MDRVYLETSFVSACVTSRVDSKSQYRREVSREWWAVQSTHFDLVSSLEVIRELSQPEHAERDAALALIANVPLLDLDDEVAGVATVFVREFVMPKPVAGDALHVAAAAVHAVPYILSWNVRHLANPNKEAHLLVVCRRLGLAAPKIVTPDFLWEIP